MKEHGILFKSEMVQGLMNVKVGSWPAEPIDPSKPFKWQTRRIVKPQPLRVGKNGRLCWSHNDKGGTAIVGDDGPVICEMLKYAPHGPASPDGRKLWCRESWRVSKRFDTIKPSAIPVRGPTTFYGDLTCSNNNPKDNWVYDNTVWPELPDWAGKQRPSLLMPRWCSRWDGEVMDTGCHRVNETSEQDAKAEGVALIIDDNPESCDVHCGCNMGMRICQCREVECNRCDTYRKRFLNLWNSIHAKPKPVVDPLTKKITHYVSYPWQDGNEFGTHRGKPWFIYGNPWVFAYSMKRTR